MLDIKFIRENPEEVKESVQRRKLDVDLDEILELDKKRRLLLKEIEDLRAQMNKITGKIAQHARAAQAGGVGIGPIIPGEARQIKRRISQKEPILDKTEKELNELLFSLPNLLHPDVPDGKDESDNVEIKSWGGKPEFDFEPKDHEQLGEELDIIDIARAAKTSGSGFFFLKNEAALLEMALIRFVFDFLTKKGFTPLIAPELVREKVAEGTGYIPRRETPDIYKIENEDLWLSATAEVPLTAYHMDEVLKEDELPKNYVGFSSCFRREAGAYGKHKKGIFRVHQFDKVEIYKFVKGDIEHSAPAFKEIISLEEEIYQKLKIPYRIVGNCTGDMSAPAYLKYDLEYWSPVDKTYREFTSCSNCTDFQARRLNIRFRNSKNEIQFVHTLNGTALTSTRTIIAILENHQQKDGSIKIPKVLHRYLPFKEIKKR